MGRLEPDRFLNEFAACLKGLQKRDCLGNLKTLVHSSSRGMDFDEYEYLESTVENNQLKELGDKVEGGNGVVELQEKDRRKSSKQRNSDNGDDLDRQSKRSRSRKESTDQDRSLRYGSFPRDKEKGDKDRHMSTRDQRYRDREEGGRKERTRDREQAGARERDSEKIRERPRERKEYEFERERNREEEREMPKRSRSNSEKEYDENVREINRDMENTDKEYKEVRREKEYRNRDNENRRNKEKKDKVEPEADPERDQRTVFAYQISLKAGEREVYEFFSRAGKVRDVQLIMDRNTRRSKGVGYIEFYDVMSVPMAIALSGQLLLGLPVMVKPSEAEKNLVQSTADKGLGSSTGEARKLYVGNLPITIKEDHVRQVFESFGTVELVQMPVDPGTGNCKGYAFVQFSSLADAKAAENLNGQLVIAGRAIKVSAVADQAGMQEAGAKIADFDDDDGTGLSLNAHSRALLMQKLDRTGTASSITGSAVAPLPGQVSVPVLPGLASADLSVPPLSSASLGINSVPSECLLLQNMFDPNSETEPEFDLDIKEDVQEECSKFGTLKHIHVEKNSAGFVYLQFEDTHGATAAKNALHGRWFAGKMITATFMAPLDYETKFPDSR